MDAVHKSTRVQDKKQKAGGCQTPCNARKTANTSEMPQIFATTI
jgi:hypothetical protein